MAITGKFLADFSSFSDAVAKAEVQLKGFESNANKVSTSLNKMSNSLSGTKLIQDATLMATAVEKIGGVSKLTETELQRVASQAQEAAAKMRVLGIGVPENLQKIADAAKPASEGIGTLLGSLEKVAAVAGIGFSVGAAIEFGKALVEDAAALDHMSEKTGVSLQGLQRFRVAGDDAGNSVEELTSAIAKMEDKLVSGDKSAVAALGKLNLPLEDLRRLKPENQFIAISDAIRQVQDPAQQVAIAIDLFGKAGAEVLPTLKRGFDDLKGAAVGMSDETVQTLKEADDLWKAFVRDVKTGTAEGVVGFVHLVQDGLTPTGHALGEMSRAADQARKDLKALVDAIPPAGLPGLAPLTVPTADSAEVARFLRESEEALRKQEEARRRGAEAAKKAAEEIAKANQQYFDSVVDLNRAITDIEQPMTDVVIRMREWQSVGEKVPVSVDGITKAFEKLQSELARVEQQGLPAVFTQEGLAKIGERVEVSATHIRTFGDQFKGALGDAAQILDNISGKFAEIGAVAVRTGQAIAKNLAEGNIFGAVVAGVVGVGTAIKKLFTSPEIQVNPIRQAFVDAAGGLAALNQHAHDVGLTLERLLNAKNPKDYAAAVDELTAAFNRLDALQTGAAQFGLSQQQRDAAVKNAQDILDFMVKDGTYTADALDKAYTNYQQKLADAGSAEAEAWLKAHAAVTAGATAADKAISDLQAKRDELTNGIAQEAPEAVMGVIETQMRGQMAALDQQIADANKQQQEAANQTADVAGTAMSDAASQYRDDWVKAGTVVSDTTTTQMDTAAKAMANSFATQADQAATQVKQTFDFSLRIPIIFDTPSGIASPAILPQATGGESLPGFASGTQGQFLDFGRGTPVLLHGRERVMTEGERRSDSRPITFGDVHVYAAPGDDEHALMEKFVTGLRTNARAYLAIQTVAQRAS